MGKSKTTNNEPNPMTPDQFRAVLISIGWSERELALRINVSPSKVRRWSVGRYSVPPKLAVWLRGVALIVAAYPVPVGWDNGVCIA